MLFYLLLGVVVNANQVLSGSYGFMTKLATDYNPWGSGGHECVGSLIAPRFVLTTARCLESANLRYAAVRDDWQSIENTWIHPDYDSDLDLNNFGLVQLHRSVSDMPILLSARKDEAYGEMATLIRWKHRNDGRVMEERDLKMISPDVCRVKRHRAMKQNYANGWFTREPMTYEVPDSVLCVSMGNIGYTNLRMDSGEPLMKYNDYRHQVLIGMYSWIAERDWEDAPMGFARVSHARKFIDTIVTGHTWENNDTTSSSSSSFFLIPFHLIVFLIIFNF